MTVSFVRSNNEVDIFGDEGIDGHGDDSFVDNDAAGKVLPCLIKLVIFKELKSFLFVILFSFFSFFQSVAFGMKSSPIKDEEGFDVVIREHIEHLKNVIQKVDGLDILVKFHCTAVAALVNPWHGIDRHCFILEGGDVLFLCYWTKQV